MAVIGGGFISDIYLQNLAGFADVDLNLTVPAAHAVVHGVLVECTPDTALGAGLQTCRDVLDQELSGEPIAATACMANLGHESWHPQPDFYDQPGAGPQKH